MKFPVTAYDDLQVRNHETGRLSSTALPLQNSARFNHNWQMRFYSLAKTYNPPHGLKSKLTRPSTSTGHHMITEAFLLSPAYLTALSYWPQRLLVAIVERKRERSGE
jgi:hypothetical protein